ncbi:MAG: polyprenyl synthetase family protein [Desulfobacterales bacterium]|nr:polyprenyl synthetase family protein [Desulfobacterales bacterium]
MQGPFYRKTVTTFDFENYLKGKQQEVNAALEKLWKDVVAPPTPLIPAMRYSLLAGGKRLRPILCIAGCEAAGGSQADVMPVACALELVHTYSLIHDDLPAMDDDDLRRGKPTCHKEFDEATAVLAGDALLTAAFETIAAAGCDQRGDALKWLEVIHLVARAAGYSGMVQGQMMDISSGKEITLEELDTIYLLKTGALIEASVQAGAILGGGGSGEINALGAYGRKIGLAFQIVDDILDVEGKTEIIGKPVGSDQAHEKATGHSLMGREQAKARANELIDSALQELSLFGAKGEPLVALARYIVNRRR